MFGKYVIKQTNVLNKQIKFALICAFVTTIIVSFYFLLWMNSNNLEENGFRSWKFYLLAIVVPILGFILFCIHKGLLFKIILQLDRGFFSVICPSFSQRNTLLKWASDRLPSTWSSTSIRTLSGGIIEFWNDGSLLCILINSAIPGACSNPHRHWKKPPSHAQTIAYKYLGVSPKFTDADFNSEFTINHERNVIQFLLDLQKSINKRYIDETNRNFSAQYVARGMGLYTGDQNRETIFYIYSNLTTEKSDDLLIFIRGPYGAKGIATIPYKTDIKQTLFDQQNDKIFPFITKEQKGFFNTVTSFIGSEIKVKSLDVPIQVDKENQRYKVTYVPPHSGIYEIYLFCDNDKWVKGGPFYVRINKYFPKSNRKNDEKPTFKKRKTALKTTNCANQTISFGTSKENLFEQHFPAKTNDGLIETGVEKTFDETMENIGKTVKISAGEIRPSGPSKDPEGKTGEAVRQETKNVPVKIIENLTIKKDIRNPQTSVEEKPLTEEKIKPSEAKKKEIILFEDNIIKEPKNGATETFSFRKEKETGAAKKEENSSLYELITASTPKIEINLAFNKETSTPENKVWEKLGKQEFETKKKLPPKIQIGSSEPEIKDHLIFKKEGSREAKIQAQGEIKIPEIKIKVPELKIQEPLAVKEEIGTMEAKVKENTPYKTETKVLEPKTKATISNIKEITSPSAEKEEKPTDTKEIKDFESKTKELLPVEDKKLVNQKEKPPKSNIIILAKTFSLHKEEKEKNENKAKDSKSSSNINTIFQKQFSKIKEERKIYKYKFEEKEQGSTAINLDIKDVTMPEEKLEENENLINFEKPSILRKIPKESTDKISEDIRFEKEKISVQEEIQVINDKVKREEINEKELIKVKKVKINDDSVVVEDEFTIEKPYCSLKHILDEQSNKIVVKEEFTRKSLLAISKYPNADSKTPSKLFFSQDEDKFLGKPDEILRDDRKKDVRSSGKIAGLEKIMSKILDDIDAEESVTYRSKYTSYKDDVREKSINNQPKVLSERKNLKFLDNGTSSICTHQIVQDEVQIKNKKCRNLLKDQNFCSSIESDASRGDSDTESLGSTTSLPNLATCSTYEDVFNARRKYWENISIFNIDNNSVELINSKEDLRRSYDSILTSLSYEETTNEQIKKHKSLSSLEDDPVLEIKKTPYLDCNSLKLEVGGKAAIFPKVNIVALKDQIKIDEIPQRESGKSQFKSAINYFKNLEENCKKTNRKDNGNKLIKKISLDESSHIRDNTLLDIFKTKKSHKNFRSFFDLN